MQTKFQDLRIWQIAFSITLNVYEILPSLPIEERKNLMCQMRRAATSMTLNIAEGASSKTTTAYSSHLHYAYASAQELSACLMLCYKLKYISEKKFNLMFDELDKFLRSIYKFMVNLERKEGQKRFGFLEKDPEV
ncbi:four helix bundle protein [Candidatus Woesearchaeota archaeon]|nr:four helix bundle protein [Candidatus Woesearchaeota archaeon]